MDSLGNPELREGTAATGYGNWTRGESGTIQGGPNWERLFGKLTYYNHERPHLSLGGKTPFQRREEFFHSTKP